MFDCPDHPVIRNMERTGWPDGKEPEYPHCPVCCAREISDIYIMDDTGEILGGECCIEERTEDNGECEVCGEPMTSFSLVSRSTGEVLGCSECASAADAWEQQACFYRQS